MPQVSPLESSRTRPIGRVHGRRAFDDLRARGTRRRSGPITVTSVPDPDADLARVAYAVNRSVGSAVHRNRVRRRLRAITRELELDPGTYLVGASPAAATVSFDELARHVRTAAGR